MKIIELFDLRHTLAADYLSGFTYPWEALKGIKDMILALGPQLDKEEFIDCLYDLFNKEEIIIQYYQKN